MKKEFQRKRISYEITGRYRDGGSVDVRREVFYLVDGEWKRAASLEYRINAPMGSIQKITWQGQGEVDKDLFDELSAFYKARYDEKHVVEMDAEPTFGE